MVQKYIEILVYLLTLGFWFQYSNLAFAFSIIFLSASEFGLRVYVLIIVANFECFGHHHSMHLKYKYLFKLLIE